MTDEQTRAIATAPAPGGDTDPAVQWLTSEFPGWTIHVDRTTTTVGELRAVWIARREGHHPQAELSPGKLHTRLTEYLQREGRGTDSN